MRFVGRRNNFGGDGGFGGWLPQSNQGLVTYLYYIYVCVFTHIYAACNVTTMISMFKTWREPFQKSRTTFEKVTTCSLRFFLRASTDFNLLSSFLNYTPSRNHGISWEVYKCHLYVKIPFCNTFLRLPVLMAYSQLTPNQLRRCKIVQGRIDVGWMLVCHLSV